MSEQSIVAFRKWRTDYESDYDKKPTYLEVWQAAIAYMQEQSEPLGWFILLPDGNHDVALVDSEKADNYKKYDDCVMQPLYTTPQRQQPLKRLSGEQLDECWEKGKGKFTDVANAIMDAMQELNKP